MAYSTVLGRTVLPILTCFLLLSESCHKYTSAKKICQRLRIAMMKTEHEGQSDKVRKTLRGRAEKACVRCRAKKRTCDGGNPCQRCKESHSACYFSDWHYTVPYPREYVEYLEEQQEQLSAGLMTMYRLLKESNIRTVPALPEKPQAQDLLSVLRGLKLEHRTNNPLQRSVTSDSSESGLRMQVDDLSSERGAPQQHQAHSPLESDPRSPVPPSLFVPQFRSPSHQQQSAHTNVPSPMQPGFSSSPYRPFEFGQPMTSIGPQMMAQQPHHPPQHPHPALAARQRWLSPRENVMMQEPWRHSSDSLSPGTGTPLDGPSNRPTPLESSPYAFAGGGIGESPRLQQEWPWTYPSEVGFYGEAAANQRDSDIGLELEPIEQRGDIVMPHDSHIP